MRLLLPLVVGLVLLVGCSPVPTEGSPSARGADPIVKAVANAKFSYENRSRFMVSVSIMSAGRVTGNTMIGSREDLQPGPEKVGAKSTVWPLARGLIDAQPGFDALVLTLLGYEKRNEAASHNLAFVVPRDWFEGLADPVVRISLDDKGADLRVGKRSQRLAWLTTEL